MSDELDDFWPDLNPAAIVTPASILKTQATALSQRTKGLLQGEVETWSQEQNIYHRFNLVVPALENYRYSLLSVHHSATLYPVYVDDSPIPAVAGEDTGFALEQRGTTPPDLSPLRSHLTWVLRDERSFRAWLRKALAAADTKRILESLLAQAIV